MLVVIKDHINQAIREKFREFSVIVGHKSII
jgi:hypothetical protein